MVPHKFTVSTYSWWALCLHLRITSKIRLILLNVSPAFMQWEQHGSFCFLGTTISQDDLKREPTISSVITIAQQRMLFFRQLKEINCGFTLKWFTTLEPQSHSTVKVINLAFHPRRTFTASGLWDCSRTFSSCTLGFWTPLLRKFRSIQTRTSASQHQFLPLNC